MRRPAAFLFLGEMLLVPHLWPIAAALARLDPALPIDLWVSTSVHGTLLSRLIADEGLDEHAFRVRRAPGYLRHANGELGLNLRLPPKLPMLARLAPWLPGAGVVVCAERTSLWIPAVMPFAPRFVFTFHGSGPVNKWRDRRNRAAWRMLVPSDDQRRRAIAGGTPPERIVATGYVKTGFPRSKVRTLFADARPIVMYSPHWERHRSSWWTWGRGIVDALVRQDRFDVILAPHQRLAETDPSMPAVLAAAAASPHVHADHQSFATVDGSYTAAADIYLGDTSSLAVEFMAQPRPCVFLNDRGLAWRDMPERDFWHCGEVVDDPADVMPALLRAADGPPRFVEAQRHYAETALGDATPAAAVRAAEAVFAALRSQP